MTTDVELPGAVLQRLWMTPFKLTAYQLSQRLHVSQTRISEILRGKRKITHDTALRLSRIFGNAPMYWMGLQIDYDLHRVLCEKGEQIKATTTPLRKLLTHKKGLRPLKG